MKEINKINHKRWIKNAQLHLIPNLVSDIGPWSKLLFQVLMTYMS